jgi:hypothetical protein
MHNTHVILLECICVYWLTQIFYIVSSKNTQNRLQQIMPNKKKLGKPVTSENSKSYRLLNNTFVKD